MAHYSQETRFSSKTTLKLRVRDSSKFRTCFEVDIRGTLHGVPNFRKRGDGFTSLQEAINAGQRARLFYAETNLRVAIRDVPLTWGKDAEPQCHSIDEALAKWLHDGATVGTTRAGPWSDLYCELNEGIVERLNRLELDEFSAPLGEVPVSRLRFASEAVVRSLVTLHDLAPATVNNYLTALRGAHAVALGREWIQTPLAMPPNLPVAPRAFWLAERDVARLCAFEPSNSQDLRDLLMVLLLYSPSLRLGEARAVQWRDFETLENSGSPTGPAPGYVKICRNLPANVSGAVRPKTPKSGKTRRTVVPPRVLELLARWREHTQPAAEDSYVFEGHRDCDVIGDRSISRAVRRLAELLDIHCVETLDTEDIVKTDKYPTPHVFRHSFATHLQRVGAPEEVIGFALGHAQTHYGRSSVTRGYMHARPDQRIDELVEWMRKIPVPLFPALRQPAAAPMYGAPLAAALRTTDWPTVFSRLRFDPAVLADPGRVGRAIAQTSSRRALLSL